MFHASNASESAPIYDATGETESNLTGLEEEDMKEYDYSSYEDEKIIKDVNCTEHHMLLERARYDSLRATIGYSIDEMIIRLKSKISLPLLQCLHAEIYLRHRDNVHR